MRAIGLRRSRSSGGRSGPVGVAATLAAAAGAAAALALGASPAGAAAPPCSAGQLAAVYVNGTAGAGSRDAEYGFRNRGRPCTLRGFPGVVMLATSGAALPTTEQRAPGAYGIAVGLVPLGHGAVAYFGVHYASQTGYDGLRCPTSVALRLTPPGATAALVVRGGGGIIQPYGGTIPHLRCGIVHVSPVGARRFQ